MLHKLQDVDVESKIILLRVDFNVPIENGIVKESFRIDEVLPTIRYLLDKKCKVIIVSHLGRPNYFAEEQYSLQPIYIYLKSIFSSLVFMHQKLNDDLVNDIKNTNANLILLENIRYYKEEELNDVEFAKLLARCADIFVNEAFSCCHRLHASLHQITNFIPSYAGLLLQKELSSLNKYYSLAEKPLLAIIGGAKISTKINLITSLLDKVDILLIGGAMANNFLKAQNIEIGKSLYEPDYVDVARNIIELAHKKKIKLILPVDYVVANSVNDNMISIISLNQDLEEKSIFDIGPATIALFKQYIAMSKTILWNGPMGLFEIENFSKGTKELAIYLAKLNKLGIISTILGGGDSVAAVNKYCNKDDFSYVSTAGGAFLEWLENESLPCINL